MFTLQHEYVTWRAKFKRAPQFHAVRLALRPSTVFHTVTNHIPFKSVQSTRFESLMFLGYNIHYNYELYSKFMHGLAWKIFKAFASSVLDGCVEKPRAEETVQNPVLAPSMTYIILYTRIRPLAI